MTLKMCQNVKNSAYTGLYLPVNPCEWLAVIVLHGITAESNIKAMKIREMVASLRRFWLINKFSLSLPWEKYKEQYGEYVYWC